MKPSTDYLRDTRSVAVIGASERSPYAAMAVRNLVAYGFAGEILPVHRAGGTLLDHKVYRDIESLPVDPDLAVIGVSPDRAIEAVEQLASRGCRRVVLIADGYDERADDVGVARTDQLRRVCEQHQVELVGPNGIGIAAFADSTVLICEPIPAGVRPGHVSIVSHSGALISGMLDGFVTESVGVNVVVSVGNGVVTGLLDWLEWMVDDPATTTVACYAEGIDDLARFREIAERAATRGVLVVLLAAGRHALARDIALSHTASIATDRSLLEALCADTGVALVPDIETMVTVCHLHDRGLAADSAAGRGPIVITASGGAATLSADLAGDAGLKLPDLSDVSRSLLAEFVSASGYIGNPMDLTASGGLDEESRLRLYESLLGDEKVTGGLYVLGVTYPDDADFRAMHRSMLSVLARSTERTGQHVIITGVADQEVTDWMGRLVRDNPRVGLVRSLRRSADALAILQRRTQYARADPAPLAEYDHRADHTEWISEPAAKDLLASCGLSVPPGSRLRHVDDLDGLPGNGPYAVKGVVRGALHKARLGLVGLGAVDAAGVRTACEAIRRSATEHGLDERFEGFLVEEMVGGFEVMVSVRWVKGVPFLTLALGGTLVEALRTSASIPLPMHATSWDSLLDRSGLHQIVEALPAGGAESLCRVCELVGRHATEGSLARFETVELNPVIIGEDGQAHIVDAVLL
ncbi:acetate--CoA ligase family protein [Amycolatopsis pithecellobii]|uniref:CoA-binding domain-containing protein n=1 Tax=Amycolatopsis pithecellobii TaxID=664692 RepID=A0A6N7YVX6_9PSEU|nr:acetate--CoA ligase family protein [Amycolatopsis pithecellobii]MTD52479.1 hypothetical protein [Amycolatopsis pithecellobii]